MPTRLRHALPEILFSLVALLLVLHCVLAERAVFLAIPGSDWNSSEWLIDYAGGFVRRGLAGEYVVHLMRLTGWSFLSIWIATTTAVFLALCAWLVSVSARLGGRPLWRFALLFSPALLLSQGWYSSIGRKDSLFLLGMLAIAAAAEFALRRNPATASEPGRARPTALLVAVSLLCSLTLALLHEGILLFAMLPLSLAVVIYVLRSLRWNAGAILLMVAIAFGPSLAASALSSLYHGDASTAVTICRSWHTLNIQTDCTLNDVSFPPALDALSWNLRRGLSLSLKYSTRLPVFFVIFAALASVQIFSVRAIASANLDELIATWLVPFVLSLPLYLLGDDWGRWMCMTSALSLIIMLSPSLRPAVLSLLPAPLRTRFTTFAAGQLVSRNASTLTNLAQRHPILFCLVLLLAPLPYAPTLGAIKSVPAAFLIQTLHHGLHLSQ